MATFDLAVVGGGIVGLATAYQFTQRYPGRRVVVLEKEARVAEHQTGHNSGVLHSGIYYKPGSLKAINCRAGKKLMEEFCAAEGIAYEICGKVIVAVDRGRLARVAADLRARPGERRHLHADRQGPARRAGAACRRHPGDPRPRSGDRQLPSGLRATGRAGRPGRRRGPLRGARDGDASERRRGDRRQHRREIIRHASW